MEVKKTTTQQQVAATTSKEAALSSFKPMEWLGGIKDEFRKITWTSPEELKVYTKIVVGATFFFGMGIYFMDLLIQGFLNGLALAIRLIAG